MFAEESVVDKTSIETKDSLWLRVSCLIGDLSDLRFCLLSAGMVLFVEGLELGELLVDFRPPGVIAAGGFRFDFRVLLIDIILKNLGGAIRGIRSMGQRNTKTKSIHWGWRTWGGANIFLFLFFVFSKNCSRSKNCRGDKGYFWSRGVTHLDKLLPRLHDL